VSHTEPVRTAIGESRLSSFFVFFPPGVKKGVYEDSKYKSNIYLKVRHLHSVSTVMRNNLSIMIRTVSDRKSERYETF
jgi:hypothetical protein